MHLTRGLTRYCVFKLATHSYSGIYYVIRCKIKVSKQKRQTALPTLDIYFVGTQRKEVLLLSTLCHMWAYATTTVQLAGP